MTQQIVFMPRDSEIGVSSIVAHALHVSGAELEDATYNEIESLTLTTVY